MNNQIFYFFYNFAHQSIFLDKIIVFLAVYFPYIVVIFAGLFLLFYHKILLSRNPFKEFINKWKYFFIVFFPGFLAVFISVVLKLLFHTDRPFIALSNVYNLLPSPESYSDYAFPSGHAAIFSALAFAIFFVNKKVGYIFMFFALLIGLARITAGVHFPIDILGGFILGAGVAFLVKNV